MAPSLAKGFLTMAESDPRPPIVVIEGGDVAVFPSIVAAEMDLEPSDVSAGIYAAFDSVGRQLSITHDGARTRISVPTDQPSAMEPLKSKLRDYLASVGDDRSHLADMPLSMLIDACSEYAQAGVSWWSRVRSLVRGIGRPRRGDVD